MIAALIAAAALAAQTGAGAEADRRFADLQLIYSQSCEVRAYATFDRMCSDLKRQIRAAEKAHRKAARTRPAAAPAPAQTAQAEPQAARRD